METFMESFIDDRISKKELELKKIPNIDDFKEPLEFPFIFLGERYTLRLEMQKEITTQCPFFVSIYDDYNIPLSRYKRFFEYFIDARKYFAKCLCNSLIIVDTTRLKP